MRKKNHKKINPRNSAYDKFYMINYLEMGESWKQDKRVSEYQYSYLSGTQYILIAGTW